MVEALLKSGADSGKNLQAWQGSSPNPFGRVQENRGIV